MSGDLEELGFRERPVEKLDPFVQCKDDETRDSLIAVEKAKAAKLKAELYGIKMEVPAEPVKSEGKKVESAASRPVEIPKEPAKSAVQRPGYCGPSARDRLKMNFRNLGGILADTLKCPGLNLSEAEQELASEDTINILDLTDEKLAGMSKMMSAVELGGLFLSKAIVYSKKVGEE